ncbi:MAG: PTS sugar transporter subunit IIA [Alphaproteobacteria bacterium]|nr:PTS sugar transporter subunit IIA [Alphaproteobacteria bacterium]
MEIADILAPQAVFERLKAPNKKKLITDLAACAAQAAHLDANTVFETLWEREKLSSTGVGHGIAIPHGRVAKLEKIVGVFAHLDEAIDYESIDEAPVDLVFALLTPADAGADHLKALARVSRLMRNAAYCEKLRAANDRAQLYALLTEPTAGIQAA